MLRKNAKPGVLVRVKDSSTVFDGQVGFLISTYEDDAHVQLMNRGIFKVKLDWLERIREARPQILWEVIPEDE